MTVRENVYSFVSVSLQFFGQVLVTDYSVSQPQVLVRQTEDSGTRIRDTRQVTRQVLVVICPAQ